jgi:hypothetical protein
VNEEEIKIKIVLPFLERLGISPSELKFEKSFFLRVGRHSLGITPEQRKREGMGARLDILVSRNGMEEIDNPHVVERYGSGQRPPPDKEAVRRDKLKNSLLTYALPPSGIIGRKKNFDRRPWLAQEQKWREWFCRKLIEHQDGLGYGRILKKTPDRAFHVGISRHFPFERSTEERQRICDQDTGLEVLLVTIDWGNFRDSEIIKHFRKWLKSEVGRPKGVGSKTMQGKRSDAWRKKLERLALLRLRHHYSLYEMTPLLPVEWESKDKFIDITEVERERKGARKTLFELFPFLPADTEPLNWSRFR